MDASRTKHRIFLKTLWEYYADNRRDDLPWRVIRLQGTVDPYHVLVSEIMLQQTQVTRVIPKFNEFIARFPGVHSLADARLTDVLERWQGLGYNRRAKFLREAARSVVGEYGGRIPDEVKQLMSLTGVGKNTAGAIMVYAYNRPEIFIETNIRTVYLYHYFSELTDVTDAQIRHVLLETLDADNPRDFYWALMDYGTYLKSQLRGINQKSKHFKKQSPFKGSSRELRASILFSLNKQSAIENTLRQQFNDSRFDAQVSALIEEKLIVRNGSRLLIAP